MHRRGAARRRETFAGFRRAALAPRDRFVLTVEGDLGVVVWNLKGRPLARIVGHVGPVAQVWFAGGSLVTAGEDATLLVWEWKAIEQWLDEKTGAGEDGFRLKGFHFDE